MHEFLMVAEAPHWKKWGVVAKDVKEGFAMSIESLNEGGLAKGWKHSTGKRGSKAPNSTTVHNRIQEIIQNSNSLDQFKRYMKAFAEDHIEGGYDNLPSGFHD